MRETTWLKVMAAGAVLSIVTLSVPAAAQNGPRVAIVADGPSDTHRTAAAALAEEVNGLIGDRYRGWTFPDAPTHEGDFSEARVQALVQEVLADRDIDLVVGFGVRVGQAIGATEQLPKPVFLPYAAPEIQGLPRDGERSGRRNLSYLAGLINLQRDLERFRDVIRRTNVTVITDQHYFDAIPGLQELIVDSAGDTMTVSVVPAGDTAAAILDAIPDDSESVYIGPLLMLPASETQALIDGLNRRRLPTYASEGREWVEMGAFVSVVPRDDTQRRMRRMALNIESALDGDDPARFGTGFASRAELVINMATARRIRVFPRFELMTEAELLGEDQTRRGRELSIQQAVTRALAVNVDLALTRHDVVIADAQLDEARGALFPVVDATGNFQWNDPDVSFAGNAERTISWGISAQQIIYSPLAWGAFSAQQDNLESSEHGLRTQELDTIIEVVEAYLNVLRALTAEQVNRENLRRVRRNLALAEVRVDIGSAGREEVLRWQTEIADSRVDVISAIAQRNQAEINLNRILNRRQEAPLNLSDPMDPSTGLLFVDPRVRRYVQDQWSFRIFRAFMTDEAFRNSPELRQIDAAIGAQDSLLAARRLQLWVPDVFISGGFTHTFHRSGAGSEAINFGMGEIELDEFTWQFGAGLSFNLFDASRYAVIEQTEVTISQLRTQREQIAQAIEQRVRSALHQVGASAAAVSLRRDAATAADGNLEIIADSYRQGTVNLITLIDAQTQALQSGLAAANAQYDFLIDFANVERAAGRYGFLENEDERNDFATRLERFAQAWDAEADARRERRQQRRREQEASE
ncbi:MAG: TolC family protein [Myxococcota bacterium]